MKKEKTNIIYDENMHMVNNPAQQSTVLHQSSPTFKNSKKSNESSLKPQNTHKLFSNHIFLTMSVTATLTFLFLCFSLLFSSTSSNSIHDLLQSQGLPAGIFPNNVKSYDLDESGVLQVHLDRPCMAKFETRVYFDSVVRANLSYGGLMGLEGISQEELFLWLPVKDIIVDDPSSGLILFDIGVAHKQLSLSLFEDPPVCKPQGVLVQMDVERNGGFQVLR